MPLNGLYCRVSSDTIASSNPTCPTKITLYKQQLTGGASILHPCCTQFAARICAHSSTGRCCGLWEKVGSFSRELAQVFLWEKVGSFSRHKKTRTKVGLILRA